MNLTLLRQIHADLFYPQDWFRGQPFMQAEPQQKLELPTGFSPTARELHEYGDQPSAVEYALLYVRHPDADIFERFLWTRDTDTQGQPIYVGGVGQGRVPGFQIHRHLTLDDKWGVATWK